MRTDLDVALCLADRWLDWHEADVASRALSEYSEKWNAWREWWNKVDKRTQEAMRLDLARTQGDAIGLNSQPATSQKAI